MAQYAVIDLEVSGDYISDFCCRANVIFRTAGVMPSNMDLFSKLPIDFESRSYKDNWARTIWYVFSQIYTCESIVTESFQPFHSEVPGMQQVSGSDGFFQPRPLKDM